MLKKNQLSLILILFIIFIAFYILNTLTPHLTDDCQRFFIFNTEIKVSNLKEVLISQYRYYMGWGGRTQFIWQSLLLFPKTFFNILNSLMIIAMLFGVYLNLDEVNKKNKTIFCFITILFLYWFGIPRFGETTIWMSGAINYLWNGAYLLFFTYLLKKLLQEKSIIQNKYYLAIIGFFGGWTNENLALGILVSFIIYLFITKKLKNILENKPLIYILSGFIVGLIFMLVAPGNFVRAKYYDGNDGIFWHTFDYLISLSSVITMSKYVWFSLIILILILIFKNKKQLSNLKKILIKYSFELLICITSLLAMWASPIFYERASFGSILYLIIFVINLILKIIDKVDAKKLIYTCAVLIIFLGASYFVEVREYSILNRENYICNATDDFIPQIAVLLEEHEVMPTAIERIHYLFGY